MKRTKEQHAAEFCGREPNSDKLETKHLEITPSRIAIGSGEDQLTKRYECKEADPPSAVNGKDISC